MNFRMGFFRLWAAIAAIWVGFFLISTFSNWDFESASRHWNGTSPSRTEWKIIDGSNPDETVIMISGRKFEVSRDAKFTPFTMLSSDEQQKAVEEMAEQMNVSHAQLAVLDTQAADYIQSQFTYALLPPIFLLAFGIVANWVISGFRKKL